MSNLAIKQADLDFKPQPQDRSLHDMPTDAVEVWQQGQLIGTYRYNIHDMRDDKDKIWRVHAPLVIKWAEGYSPETGINHAIIDDCLERTESCLQQLPDGFSGIILATGNLTVERAGKPFFMAKGWHLGELQKQSGADFDFDILQIPLPQIAAYIDKISAPFRIHPQEINALCFAWLRFSHEK